MSSHISHQAESARESARDPQGRFGAHAQGQSGARLDPDDQTTGLDDIEERREQRSRNAELDTQVRQESDTLARRRTTSNLLKAHEVHEQMRDTGVSSLRIVAHEGDESYYISHANMADGGDRVDESDVGSWWDDLEDGLYDRFSVDDLDEVADFDPAGEIRGWRIDALDHETGEALDPKGQARDDLQRQRDQILAEAQPKGPRQAIRAALPDDPEVADDVIDRLDENQGLDSHPNEWTDTIDDEFPDDVERRRLAREVTEVLERDYDLDPDSPDDHEAFATALEAIRANPGSNAEGYGIAGVAAATVYERGTGSDTAHP